jgi:hypothetical protein
MTDNDGTESEQSSLKKSTDINSELKEMLHYGKFNMEKLAEFWLYMDDDVKRKDIAEKLLDLQGKQGELHEALEAVIDFIDMEINRITSEGGDSIASSK